MSNKLRSEVLPFVERGQLFVVSAPAGTGKTTLVEMLCEEFDPIVESISCTTRAARQAETDGEHYHFLSREDFQQRIDEDEFIEYVELWGNFYGTSAKMLEEQRRRHHVMLTIDTEGALRIKRKTGAVLIFIMPPSFDELARRLTERNTESDEAVRTRLNWAEKELAVADQYDYQVLNDDLEVAYQVLRSIVIAETHRVPSQKMTTI